MLICCTKKLLDQIGVKTQSIPEENDFFCWSANLITINRRKAIVVVNDNNRYGFVLYGLKVKDFKDFDELILQGIRLCLRDEKIKEEMIEKYIQSAGDLKIGKTRGRNYVARLNKACERVDIFDDLLVLSEIFQKKSSRRMNADYIKNDKTANYAHPYELLYMDFRQYYGDEIISCESVDLIIKLNLGKYNAWRKIITPDDITFREFHEIIQKAYNWKDYHLYEFNVLDHSERSLVNIISENEELYDINEECEVQLDSEMKLKQYIKKNQKILYCYDYGENWEHQIIIQGSIADYDKNYPICVLGEGNAPPEDVGGVYGYEAFVDIIKDADNEEYESTKIWARSQGYEDFDIEQVNYRLKGVLR